MLVRPTHVDWNAVLPLHLGKQRCVLFHRLFPLLVLEDVMASERYIYADFDPGPVILAEQGRQQLEDLFGLNVVQTSPERELSDFVVLLDLVDHIDHLLKRWHFLNDQLHARLKLEPDISVSADILDVMTNVVLLVPPSAAV